MYGWGWQEELAKERLAERRAEAEEERLARMVTGPTLGLRLQSRFRSWAARKLFEVAVATDGEETWRTVWERLRAPERL